MDEDDDDGAVTISSPSPAETPESPPSQVQPTLVSSSPVRNATCNQHLCSCRKSCVNIVKGQTYLFYICAHFRTRFNMSKFVEKKHDISLKHMYDQSEIIYCVQEIIY